MRKVKNDSLIIGIDGSEANEIQRVGSGQYAWGLLWAYYRINKQRKNKIRFIIYLKQPEINELPEQNIWWKYENLPAKGFWILTKLLPRLYKSPKPDVFFSPNHYLPIFTKIPQVCTIHDLGYLMFSGQFRKYDFWQLKYWSAISIIISKYIIAVSRSVKKEIVRQYPFASKKIKVIHHGYDKDKFNTNIDKMLVRRTLEKYKIGKNYMLFLGTVKPSKNIENIVKSFEELKEKNAKFSGLQLVIAGKKGWLYDDIVKKVSGGAVKDINYTGYVTEDEKRALLEGAMVLVSPSYWEGFGMHVVESMACGTPVVVSRIDALKEIVGDAGIYVDTDPGSIAKGLEKVLRMHKKDYNKLVERGLERVRKYSWLKTAKATLEVLEEAAKGK